MLRKTHLRRPLTVLLVIVGAMMMFLAPETWMGALVLALGVVLEIIGIALKYRDQQKGTE